MRQYVDTFPEPIHTWMTDVLDGPLWQSAEASLQKSSMSHTLDDLLASHQQWLTQNVVAQYMATYTPEVASQRILSRKTIDPMMSMTIEDYCIQSLCVHWLQHKLQPTERLPQFPTLLTREKVEFLHGELIAPRAIDGSFIDPATSLDTLLYVFGITHTPPTAWNPIRWMRQKQLLRNLIEGLYAPIIAQKKGRAPIPTGMVSKAELERIVLATFTDKDGHPIALPKPRCEYVIGKEDIYRMVWG